MTEQLQNEGPRQLSPEQRQAIQRRNQERIERLAAMVGEDIRKPINDWKTYGTADDQAKQQAIFERLKSIGNRLHELVPAGVNIVLYGPMGTGKDLAMNYLMRMLVTRSNCWPIWRNGPELLADIRKSESVVFVEREGKLVSELTSPKVLCISDPLPPLVGLSARARETLLHAIDVRYRKRLPTWITVNVNSRVELEQRAGELITDRLLHHAEKLFFDWGSFREYESTQPAGSKMVAGGIR